MNESLRYTLPLVLETKATGETGIVEGYASTFGGPPDWHGDIVAPGAFTASLAEHKAAGTTPAMFWAHDQKEPIGKWLNLEENSQGLWVRGKLTMAVQRAKDAYELARDGALAFSIGFSPVRKSSAGGANLLEAVRLGEISLVGLAANPRAVITSVKSLSEIDTIRDYEKLMRDCFGLSVREAKRLSMGGWKAYRGIETDTSMLADALRASAQNWRLK